MNRIARRQKAALVLFIALTVSGVGVAMADPQTGDQPGVTLDVSPNNGANLPSPSTITVTGAGFPANTSGVLVQSADLPTGVTTISGTLGTFTSNASGGFMTNVNVTSSFVPDAGGDPIDCNASNVDCFIEAFTNSGNANSRHTLSFVGGTTTSSTSTTLAPTTTSSTSTTLAPTTTSSTSTSTTLAPTTTSSTSTSTTLAPTTTSSTSTTLAPTTTSSTVAPTTTTIGGPTTTLGATQCAQIRAARVQLNAQIDAARQQILQAGLSPQQEAAALAQLEAIRTQGNAQLDALLVGCPPVP